MRRSEDRRAPDPERKLLSMFPEAEVFDILDAFGDPDGEFAEEPGEARRISSSRGRSKPETDAVTNDGPFPDVPDADAVAAGSPVDPVSPPDEFHGTDLLNGAVRTADETSQDR
ncbi:hypothetical protein Theco_0826 [Thermobacillus composti KWC4]|jgi:hypothetical protein|uniref:Uncharacterized protein n=1 Tax=Thermobacillus composti (strain DSM 18247 / JCM 13945 / KWC4) TaxID=717605 RepID=L0ECY9_THECK|nr:hypothetical protein [Thermobacillus composti]AGA57025.1 hypothetical protein Theco_0826 [Thermobacillus composti KWC4]REJ17927.1 MAG: hypothetical protein C6W59_06060 [Paenibacillaceae bacterium]